MLETRILKFTESNLERKRELCRSHEANVRAKKVAANKRKAEAAAEEKKKEETKEKKVVQKVVQLLFGVI